MEETGTAVLAESSGVRPSALSQLMGVIIFASLTAVGAHVVIPHLPVPYTLQSFFVLMAGGLLGKRNGFFSQLLYLSLGILGMPFFSESGFGFSRILGPTGGYLIGFPIAAFVVGYLLESRVTLVRSAIAMVFGLLIIFSLGTLQLNFAYFHDWGQAFLGGFLIFSWWDGLKLAAAAGIVSVIRGRRT
ncbi:MAG TPA: biotin transporter BioY [Bacteroidota bacterium]|nr:biotin transporter BioY [Bacteroidota bacterium]